VSGEGSPFSHGEGQLRPVGVLAIADGHAWARARPDLNALATAAPAVAALAPRSNLDAVGTPLATVTALTPAHLGEIHFGHSQFPSYPVDQRT
jgi:hypothetical protein